MCIYDTVDGCSSRKNKCQVSIDVSALNIGRDILVSKTSLERIRTCWEAKFFWQKLILTHHERARLKPYRNNVCKIWICFRLFIWFFALICSFEYIRWKPRIRRIWAKPSVHCTEFNIYGSRAASQIWQLKHRHGHLMCFVTCHVQTSLLSLCVDRWIRYPITELIPFPRRSRQESLYLKMYHPHSVKISILRIRCNNKHLILHRGI